MPRGRRLANDFLKVSKALKDAGEKGLRRELHRNVRVAVKPLIPKARAAARAELPKRGGLNRRVAGSPMRTKVSTGRSRYGVRIEVIAAGGRGARRSNRGVIRHPVFGNRERWVDQRVPDGWFDDTMRAAAPAIRRDVEKAIEKTLNDIARRGRR